LVEKKSVIGQPCEICLAAIAEKMMNGFAKVAMTVECRPPALGFTGRAVNGDDAWPFQ
jgi:hypothetical protein